KSNKLKDMSGGWTLKPAGADKTTLILDSYVDPGLPVPRFIIDHFVRMKVKGRLKRTKKLAEELYTSSKAQKTVAEPDSTETAKQSAQPEPPRISEKSSERGLDSSNQNP
ncbi:MAG: hypothetical protein K2Z81_03765, partial [Cyanobacteria bacterium]|nr:hypothetical protein [Cyanobacteriota bacterium]